MNFDIILQNITSPPVMFFVLGIISVSLKSDLDVPPAIAKFFSLYLLFDIGIKGGEELYHSGFTIEIALVMTACIAMSVTVPLITYRILRAKLDPYNAGAIAAAYGSVSAVTFATAQTFLSNIHVSSHGYMVAGMAIMESPAIVMGLFLIRKNTFHVSDTESSEKASFKAILREAFFNGSIILLVGSLIIGYIGGDKGEAELHTFVKDIFKGMLCLYLLEMGIVAGGKLSALKKSGLFLVLFAIITPLINATIAISLAYLMRLSVGDALLFTILCASASYIAVPAAMRMAVPQANMSILLPMTLGITFPFNIAVGIPIYYGIIHLFWK
ncbi:MAG: sodium-dependent bicarbonate transport family permease [Cytophagaceae bacterium]|nr:sodium-dependent bicarbonate transport family permease [Cytophagaceae bacterium]MDW8455602.1 sodium-dependent bicarbonate transport family permease [Cytophagaceae bacterium]